MRKSETAKVLVFAASIDGREVTTQVIDAWHDLLGDMEYGVALEAARLHFANESRALWPADVIFWALAVEPGESTFARRFDELFRGDV